MELTKQVEGINKQPYVSLEGDIKFDTSALPKIEKIMSQHKDIDDFIQNESLSNKMIIAKYLNTGKWEDEPISLTKIDDQTARNYGDMLLREYAGIDTRGLIKVDVGIGAHVDEFVLEKRIDSTFQAYLDPERQGSKMKAGRVFQLLQPTTKVVKKEQNFTQFAGSKGLPSDYNITDHSALSPSGHVSARAKTESIKSLEKRISDNRVAHEEYRKAILLGEIVDPDGDVTKEGLEAEQATRTAKDVASQKQILQGHIKDIENLGRMSHKDNGQLKIGYQRMVDEYNVQLKGIDELLQPKNKEPMKMTKDEYFTFVTQHPEQAPKGLRSIGSTDDWVETGRTGEYRGEKTHYLRNTDTGEVREWPANEMAKMKSSVLSYDAAIGKVKPKVKAETVLKDAIFGQSIKERPNLNNIIGLHPSNGSWANFLKDAELREEKNGIKHYISSNGHYIVLPDGEVITFYGIRGQSAFNAIVENKDKWLSERAKAEKEMDELLHPETTKKKPDDKPTPEFTKQYYLDAAKRQRKMANEGAENISNAGMGSMKGYGRYKYKEPFIEKAELFESWAKTPEKYVNDTAVKSAWEKSKSKDEPEPVSSPSGKVSNPEDSGIRDGVFYDADGEPIKVGDSIKMNFAGHPGDMPLPWKLVKAEPKYSTVGYRYEPSLTVMASDGTKRTFDFARNYSPRKTEVLKAEKESWEMTAREYLNSSHMDGYATTEKKWVNSFSGKQYPDNQIAVALKSVQTKGEIPNHGHWFDVKRAIELGKSVPSDVLKDYPDLQVKPKGKETWEMTKDEYISYQASKRAYPLSEHDKNVLSKDWRAEVAIQKVSGREIPSNVLKDYSDKSEMVPVPDKNSAMYRAGYSNSVRFAYIPDFKTPQEKIDFEAGYSDGNKAKESGSNRPIIEKSTYETEPTTLQSIESSRSPLSQSSDERQEHSLILDPDDTRVEKWKRDPGSADVRGIDTPKRKGKGKPKHKSPPPTGLRRIGR